MRRRAFLGSLSALPLLSWAEGVSYPQVKPGKSFVFPRDHGAHPEFRVEWWYVTGWLEGPLGFQITFFRARPDQESNNPSSFNPRQIILAHAAIADPKRGRLLTDQRAARAGFSLAHAETERTGVWLDDWTLVEERLSYEVRIPAREFTLELGLYAKDTVLQGEGGFSRKGHRPEEASYYYSRPQIVVTGALNGRAVNGTAWLDHEWSSAYLAPEAAGWDWCGINMADGSSMTAFQMRDRKGGVHYSAPGTTFRTLRTWKSPRTGVEYPVSMEVNGLRLEPLMDDQEFDARAATGTIYWEGAVRAFSKDKEVGRGYLELTGYWKPMKL
jgi:predicted secreted hydrolase